MLGRGWPSEDLCVTPLISGGKEAMEQGSRNEWKKDEWEGARLVLSWVGVHAKLFEAGDFGGLYFVKVENVWERNGSHSVRLVCIISVVFLS